MPSVLRVLWQAQNLRQCALSWLLHRARDCQLPVVQIDIGIVHVVIVDRKFLEGSDLGIGERRGEMPASEENARSPIAEAHTGLEQRRLQRRDGECSQR